MKIFVGQIYVQPGINFPFSHQFQIFLGEELTKRVQSSHRFVANCGGDFDVIFRLSAKSEIAEVEVCGPTMFKRDKDVEFTIFIPHSCNSSRERSDCKRPLILFLNGVVTCLESLALDASILERELLELVDHIVSDQAMFT